MRYSLKVVLLATTLLAVVLGYAQWRRHQINVVCQQYRNQLVVMTPPRSWRDLLWQRFPDQATIWGWDYGGDVFEVVKEGNRISRLAAELGQLSVRDIRLELWKKSAPRPSHYPFAE